MHSKVYNEKLTWNLKMAKAWAKVLPPAKPSKSELEVYEEFVLSLLKKHGYKNEKVLILGLTPEFRDLILKHKGTPVCLDINPGLHSALKKLVKRKGKEKFIFSNWAKIHQLKLRDKYRLIIGHQSLNVVPLLKWAKIINGLKEILDSSGQIVMTVTVRHPRDKKTKPLDGYLRYRKLKGLRPPLFTEIMKDLLIGTYNLNKKYPSMSDLHKAVNRLWKNNLITEKEKKGFSGRMIQSEVKMYMPPMAWVKKLFGKYFRYKLRVHPRDSYWRNWPIFILKND